MPVVSLALALVMLASTATYAQERGRVVSVGSRWDARTNGDLLIVSDVVIDTPGGRVATQMDGGTIGDLTLNVIDDAVPRPGDQVVRQRGRWKLAVEDFVTYAAWPSSSEGWILDPANNDGVPHDAVEADMRAAAGAWTTQTQAAFAMPFEARTTGGVLANDGVNYVFFRPDSGDGTGLASAYCWQGAGVMKDCDLVVWDGLVKAFASTQPCVNGIYILDVMTHEFGHFAGLGHSTVPGATMTPGYTGCSTTQRSLEPDDIAGIESLYPQPEPEPEPEPPPPCKKKGRWACR